MKNFEERLARLEELGEKIRKSDLPLDDALAAFEEGIKLARALEKDLSKVEGRIELLMNGPEISKETDIAQSSTLAAIADAPFLSVEEQIEALSMAALSRQPTDAERERYASYVERGGPSGDRARALADIFWVMLNSTEFLFNH